MTQYKVSDEQVAAAVAALDDAFPWWPEYGTKHRFTKRGWAWGYPVDPETPVIVWEEGPYEWAIDASCSNRGVEAFKCLGLWAEAGTSFALNLYQLEAA